MRLLSCSLHSIRRHSELNLEFHRGLTLITGANETGKSSLVEALHRALFLRANATGAPVQKLRSLQHSGHPQVSVRFEARGRTWALQKRFSGQSGTASLSGQGASTHLGSEAEEQLAALLGVDEIVGSRQAGKVLPSRWAHLWVMQGEGGRDLLQLGGDHYDLRGLIEQLEQRANVALQSPLDQHLHDQLRLLVDASFSTRGVRQQSRLWRCEQTLQDCQLRLQEAEADLQQFEQASTTLDELDDEQRQLEEVTRPQLEAERSQLQQKQKQLELAETARKSLEQQLAPLERQQQQLMLHKRRLEEVSQSLETHRQELIRSNTEVERLEVLLTQHTDTTRQQRSLRDQCDYQRNALEQRGQRLRCLDEYFQVQERLPQLKRQRQQLERWQQQLQELNQRLESMRAPDAKTLQTLREQQRQLESITIRCEAMASVVTLECSDQIVRLDDTPMQPGDSEQRISSFSLSIGDGVKLRITPGTGDGLEVLKRKQQELQRTLQTSLKQWAVHDLEALEELCRQHKELITRQALLNQQRPEPTEASALKQEEASLQQRLETIELELAQGSIPQEMSDPPHDDGRRIQAELLACRHSYREVNDQVQTLNRHLQKLELELSTFTQQRQTMQLQREGLIAKTRSLEEQRLALINDHGSSDNLASAIQELTQHIQTLQDQLQELKAPGIGKESQLTLDDQLSALEHAERTLQQRLQSLSAERGGLLERCTSLSMNDPYACAEEARTRLQQAQLAHADEALVVRAQQHLLDLFDLARSDLSSRYTTPLSQSISNFLAPLLAQPSDGCQLSYSPKNGLAGLSLQRDGLNIPFTTLSGGMKEQLNAALRLALADTLRAGHDGCLPILFDDAFTNTDPERLQTVLQMLKQAVDLGLQVVVLSCDGAPYRAIADRVIELD